jgi:hypothetical protein
MKEQIQKGIDSTWSNYSDLDYWIREMSQKDGVPTKWVLKMAMKHLRSDMYDVHATLCKIKDDLEVE